MSPLDGHDFEQAESPHHNGVEKFEKSQWHLSGIYVSLPLNSK